MLVFEVREAVITLSNTTVLPPDPEARSEAPGRVSIPRIRVPAEVVFPQPVGSNVVGSGMELWMIVRVVLVPGLTSHHRTSLYSHVVSRPSVPDTVTSRALHIPDALGDTTGRLGFFSVVHNTVWPHFVSVRIPAERVTRTTLLVLGLVPSELLTMSLSVLVAEDVPNHWFKDQCVQCD